MSYRDDAVEGEFKEGKDGRSLWFPWWMMGRGYIIRSEEEYRRLRRGQRLWLKIIVPSAIVLGLFIANVTISWSGSFWIGSLVYFVLIGLLSIAHFLWVRRKCRWMRQTSERP